MKGYKIDLSGNKYNRLNVINYYGKSKGGETLWNCICDCGEKTVVQGGNLKSGHIKSCGCYQEENRDKHSLIHGHARKNRVTRTYTIWMTMKERCRNPKHDSYKYYGGSGITVCHDWDSFDVFLKDMGEAPKGLEIDRIDNNLGYFKGNCRWVTKKTNRRNRQDVKRFEYKGNSITIPEISELTKIPYHALCRRLLRWGMSIEETLKSCKTLRKVGVKNGKKK